MCAYVGPTPAAHLTLARQAVVIIKTKSELKDLSEEGGGIVAPKWHSAITNLEQRLRD
jgi:hypothetical protein